MEKQLNRRVLTLLVLVVVAFGLYGGFKDTLPLWARIFSAAAAFGFLAWSISYAMKTKK